ncbi:MAG: galactose-1-phosphate uridylyltransferase [Candidatus Goldiibacteriota bacterium HGW-Goldbacteria-1]|jgi:UDPglucose--hexose-1-phosphate uridylyltransferase|nr:MAG: galactose-1-phosphate uridylyltransferase [Candidatus Goldiibacteriota bacterium HGW-Goldbacteria-1]
MSEFRKDPLSNRWIITLDDKTFIPTTGRALPADLPEKDENCPFCPGNEDKAGKEIYKVDSAKGEWAIRVVPNNNPYLQIETQLKKKGDTIYDIIAGTGANEVIIETPLHNGGFDNISQEQAAEIIKVYRARMLDLLKDDRLEYILIFKNKGSRAGANLVHPHSQLMAMPVIPKTISDEMTEAEQYYKFKTRCPFCDTLEAELSSRLRLIKESENFVSFVPFASRTPFEVWIMPKHHTSHFYTINDAMSAELGALLKDSISRVNKALNHPPYNYMIHTAPAKSPEIPFFHWHIEILPRVKSIAGFEWGSGFYINPTLPEESAEYLRGL